MAHRPIIRPSLALRLALEAAYRECPLPIRYEYAELQRRALDTTLFGVVRAKIAEEGRA